MNAAAAGKSLAELIMTNVGKYGLATVLVVVATVYIVIPNSECQRQFVLQSLDIQKTQAETLSGIKEMVADMRSEHRDFRDFTIAAQKSHAEQSKAHEIGIAALQKLLNEPQKN